MHSSPQDDFLLTNTLNTCMLAAMQQPGTLSDRFSDMPDAAGMPLPHPGSLQLTGSGELAGFEALSSLADLEGRLSGASGSPPTPTPHLAVPFGGQPSSSLGDYSLDLNSPPFSTRSSSVVWDGSSTSAPAATGNLAAVAAAASAQMLPFEVQALIQQQQAASVSAALSASAVAEQHAQQEGWAPLSNSVAPCSCDPAPLSYMPSAALTYGLHTAQQEPCCPYSPFQTQPDSWLAAAAAAAALASSSTIGGDWQAASAPHSGDLMRLQALLHHHQLQKQQQELLRQQLLLYQAAQLGQHMCAGPQPFVFPQASFMCQPSHAADMCPPECLVGLAGCYQPYCRQVISERLNATVTHVLTAAKLLQAGDAPATTRIIGRRYFCSLKEVAKVVSSARLIIVAPDVRVSPTANMNPVRAVQRILREAEARGVPTAFALSRRGIGQVFGRDKMMSIVAIMQLDGLEDSYSDIAEEAARGRQLFAQHRDD
ncbi:hypothetical protein D9Q98_008110 [Chlorella vulgaris]|uniref:Ribosomal protein L7Ae/L30e/S12e/Gadd45 domain-containing protein n=1 Tax=Chlorella vulgaris TaxID=3077 RepID=A0A9D4TFY4_CHLVU|nr:hypothetical protein D9Q98_008110 [Chlorella vulgaris]